VDCSREKAEAILSLSRQYGSLLLRPVTTEPNSKYALSYRLETAGSASLHCLNCIPLVSLQLGNTRQ